MALSALIFSASAAAPGKLGLRKITEKLIKCIQNFILVYYVCDSIIIVYLDYAYVCKR